MITTVDTFCRRVSDGLEDIVDELTEKTGRGGRNRGWENRTFFEVLNARYNDKSNTELPTHRWASNDRLWRSDASLALLRRTFQTTGQRRMWTLLGRPERGTHLASMSSA